MPDEPVPKPTEETPPVEKKGPRGPAMMLIGASALVMLLTPVITILAIRAMSGSANAAAESMETVELTLPKVQVNVAETNATRYAQLDIVAELSSKSLEPYFQNQSTDNPLGQLRRMMASVITITSSKDLNGLITSEAKESLAEEIREALNEHLRQAEAKGMVTDVYFSGFLIQ